MFVRTGTTPGWILLGTERREMKARDRMRLIGWPILVLVLLSVNIFFAIKYSDTSKEVAAMQEVIQQRKEAIREAEQAIERIKRETTEKKRQLEEQTRTLTPAEINDALDQIQMPQDEPVVPMQGSNGYTIKTLGVDEVE